MPKGVGSLLNRTLGDTRLMRLIPAEPRCRICQTPFQGIGGQFYRMTLGRAPSKMNPQMCNACEQFAQYFRGGAELEISMLFADVRGSTTLAEGLSPPPSVNSLIDFIKLPPTC
jgi:adenylate cyclase